MSGLVEHAKHELRLAGLFSKKSDYDGALATAVMKLVKVHAAEHHSGGSHHAVVDLFNTSDPKEWMDISEMTGRPMRWQNRRQSSVFSSDGGKTWYDIDAPPPKKAKSKRAARRIR